MSNTFIETYTGKHFDYLNPRAEDIDIEDIAHALANTCRFGGHTKRFYSVAEHALQVHRLVTVKQGRPDLGLAALHHDSHEAYIGDIPTPLKRAVDGLANLSTAIDAVIEEYLGLWDMAHPVIKAADHRMLYAEGAGCFEDTSYWGEHGVPLPDWVPEFLSPGVAKARFLDAHAYETVDRG